MWSEEQRQEEWWHFPKPGINKIILGIFFFQYDLKIRLCNHVGTRDRVISDYAPLINETNIPIIRIDRRWSKSKFRVVSPKCLKSITSPKPSYSFLYTYPFSMGFGYPSFDKAIITFLQTFELCKVQLGPGSGELWYALWLWSLRPSSPSYWLI